MLFAMCVVAGIAGLIHVLFFCMESLWWTRPDVRTRFGLSEQEAQTTKLLAFNQGLFLALTVFAGIGMISGGNVGVGITVCAFACLSMLGAAVVLAFSSPQMRQGAVIQGLLPLIFLVLCAIRAMG